MVGLGSWEVDNWCGSRGGGAFFPKPRVADMSGDVGVVIEKSLRWLMSLSRAKMYGVVGLPTTQCSQSSLLKPDGVVWLMLSKMFCPCYSTLTTASNMLTNIGGGLSDHSWAAIASCLHFLGLVLNSN